MVCGSTESQPEQAHRAARAVLGLGTQAVLLPSRAEGSERWVEFRPLNQERTSRRVVWQPKRKSTGEPKKYWYHRAVALRFTASATARGA